MESRCRVHIAIVDKNTINNICNKIKTIETRFSKNKIIPFGAVNTGDIIVLKESGGAIHGYFIAGSVNYVKNFDILKLKNSYNNKVCASDKYWESKLGAKYGTLIECVNPIFEEVGIRILHKGMNGWIQIPIVDHPVIACFAGQIGSGKTTYAKALAREMGAIYINFGDIIRKIAANQGKDKYRETLQKIGQDILINKGAYNLVSSLDDYYADIKSGKSIVFDGVRHREVLDAINRTFGESKLLFVKSKELERWERYNKRTNEALTLHDFKKVCSKPVESEIYSLLDNADYVIDNNNSTCLEETIGNICLMLKCLMTGSY